MYSVYKLNKQGDSIQPWPTPFPIWNQSVGLCPVLNVASWPAYRFNRRQVRWSGIPISFRIFQFFVRYTFKGFGVVNKAEVDVFLVFSCFSDDPMDVGNLISLFIYYLYYPECKQLDHLSILSWMQAKILEWDRFIIIFAAINTPPLIPFWEDVLSQIVLYKPKGVFSYSKGE